MKNLLVILVTVGVGYAFWYQLPDAPAPAAAPVPAPPPAEIAAVAPVATVSPPAFPPLHSALDEPATHTRGNRTATSTVLLGSDNH